MQADSLAANLVAIILYFAVWITYEVMFDSRFRRSDSLNAKMIGVRTAWMTRILEREHLLLDSNLIGHSIHTATFFASTTVLILAGLVGVLGSADRIYGAIANISVILPVDQRLFEAKIAMMVLIFVYGFFKFTWAIRQLNYLCAIIGSAPRGIADPEGRYAGAMATVLGQAIANINGGFRAYYFAFAAMGWIAHPLALIAGVLFMFFVLARRQLVSPAAKALDVYVEMLAKAR